MAASPRTDSREIVVRQGPFGGPGGVAAFYDGVGDAVQITVTYSEHAVYSVQTTYQQGGTTFTTGQHGKTGPRTSTITLDFPKEYLVQVTGTSGLVSGYDVVTSLTFKTNKTTYPPVGTVSNAQFHSSPYGKVMGFFGKTGSYLDSIGVFTKFSDTMSIEGPWGGDHGDIFYDGRADKMIVEIDVEHKDVITSLKVKYAQGDYWRFWSAKHGGGSGKLNKIVFKSDEYLTQVKGTQGIAYDHEMLTSLTLITNKSQYGPFGKENEKHSFQTSPNANVLGFYGRCGSMVYQLGVYVALPSLPVKVSESWGGAGGFAFYEGRGKIDQITVVYTSNYISSLQVRYLQGGEPFEAPTHGTAQGQTVVIKLNPDEDVVQVLGTHGQGANVADLIRSLQFTTTKKTYMPYGITSGTPFASPKEGPVVGFFGRSGTLESPRPTGHHRGSDLPPPSMIGLLVAAA